MALVKGLNANRADNLAETSYHKFIDKEEMGLVIYTPLEVTDPQNFVDPERNKTIYDDFSKVGHAFLFILGRTILHPVSPSVIDSDQ